MRRLREAYPQRRFIPGETYLLWGEKLPFEQIVELAGGVNGAVLKDFYAAETLRRAKEIEARFEPVLGLKSSRISTVEQKVIWGSCSASGDIRLNWRLSMAPEKILEYVLLHELCHIRHMNHSRQFWNLLASAIPNFKPRRAWLKSNGSGLVWMFP